MSHNDWEEILRSAHAEPIDAAHYTAVRARVTAEIERSRMAWRRLAWISGVGAMAAAVLLTVELHRPEVARPAPVAIAIPPAPAAPVVRRDPVEVARARPAARRHREPLTIKLQTSDPNIVIYWIAD
jgi:hypothetical protein